MGENPYIRLISLYDTFLAKNLAGDLSRHLFWLSDEAWARIEPHPPRGKPGKPRVDDRRVLSGVLHVLKTGCRWRDAPAAMAAHDDLQPLQPLVLARRLAQALREDRGDRAHPGRALDRQQPSEGASLGGGLKKGEWREAIGRSRGGRTSRIRCLADGRGGPLAFAPTPVHVAGVSMAIPLPEVAAPSRRLIADKACDADRPRRRFAERRITAVIPSTASRKTPYSLDRRAYRRRNVIERLFCGPKNWRGIATRSDRNAANSLAAIVLVAAVTEGRV